MKEWPKHQIALPIVPTVDQTKALFDQHVAACPHCHGWLVGCEKGAALLEQYWLAVLMERRTQAG